MATPCPATKHPRAAPPQTPRTGSARASPPSRTPPGEHLYADSDFQWPDFDGGLLGKVRPAFPDLPPAGVALALRIWGHLHGLASLEIYGHLHTQTISPDKLFQELTQLVRSLGIKPEG